MDTCKRMEKTYRELQQILINLRIHNEKQRANKDVDKVAEEAEEEDEDEAEEEDEAVEEDEAEAEEEDEDVYEATNYIVLDIETTGVIHEIIQVAYNVYNKDFMPIKKVNALINEGINKIDYYKKYTLHDIYSQGVHPIVLLTELEKDIKKAKYIIGHNISFDIRGIKLYYEKYGFEWIDIPTICTMRKSVAYCSVTNKNGHVKTPKLSELYFKCFGKEPDESKCHAADYDIAITFDCFLHLYENGIIELN